DPPRPGVRRRGRRRRPRAAGGRWRRSCSERIPGRMRGGRIVGRQNGMMSRTRMLISGGALLAGAVVLGWVIVVVFAGAVDGLDPSWNRLMIQIRQPWMLAIAYALNIIGGGWSAILLVPSLIIGLLLALRRWRAAVYAAAAFVVSVGLTQLIKEIFGRAR